MTDFFISYNSKDKQWVEWIAWTLKEAEYKVLSQALDFRPAGNFVQDIQNAAAGTKRTLVVLSQIYLDSLYAQSEWAEAFAEDPTGSKRKLLAVRINNCELTDIQQTINYIDLFGVAEEDAKQILLGALEGRANPIKQPLFPKNSTVTIPKESVLSTGYPKISTDHLPTVAGHFIGREAELIQLNEAWNDSQINLLSVVAFGGVGKSALVVRWLQEMSRDSWRSATHVLIYSFNSQGVRNDSQVLGGAFLEEALVFFGNSNPLVGSTLEKAARLARHIQQTKTLLVLDGLEPLLFGPMNEEPGYLKDEGMSALLNQLLFSNPGLCLITTRIPIADLPNTPTIELDDLEPGAGASLLQALGVKGPVHELKDASKKAQGHALTLNLLGNYLRKAHNGDVHKIDEIELSDADEKQGNRAFKLMQTYEQWLQDQRPTSRNSTSIELSILRLMGLFDRPVEPYSIAALRQPPAIDGLTNSLINIAEAEWNYAVANLQEYGLLASSHSDLTSNAPNTVNPQNHQLDTHPLIREYFATQLAKDQTVAYQSAHRRLYECLASITTDYPESLNAMMPLYHAIAHGCKAGDVQEAFVDIYWRRVARGGDYYSTQQLGAFGSDLGALSHFFKQPWSYPSQFLHKSDQLLLLSQVSVCLRALSRLNDAIKPIRANVDNQLSYGEWENAAISASDLSELHLKLGHVGQAVQVATQSVELADRSGNIFQSIVSRTKLGAALHQSDQLTQSRVVFQGAENMQAELRRAYPLLHSLWGRQYCELLLEEVIRYLAMVSGNLPNVDTDHLLKVCKSVRLRAETTLEWWRNGFTSVALLDSAFDHLTIGQTWLLEAQLTGDKPDSQSLRQAQDILLQSVDLLRQTGRQDYLPHGLLIFAELGRVQAVATGSSIDQAGQRGGFIYQAEQALAEVDLIAARGQMLIFQVDAAIERAKLALVKSDRSIASDYLAQARTLVEQTEAPFEPYETRWDGWELADADFAIRPGQMVGYHKRNDEMDVLERTIQKWEFGQDFHQKGQEFNKDYSIHKQQEAKLSCSVRLICINSANRSELEELPSIGPTLADRIIQARNQAPFKMVEDIMDVAGIGYKLFSTIRPFIIVDLPPESSMDAEYVAHDSVTPSSPSSYVGGDDITTGNIEDSIGVAIGPGITQNITIINNPPAEGTSFPGQASPSSSGSALEIWREKLDFLLKQEATITDPTQKFALKKQIEEAEAKIKDLS